MGTEVGAGPESALESEPETAPAPSRREIDPAAPGETADRPGRTGERSGSSPCVAIGIDWGATLAKVAVRRPAAPREYLLFPCAEPHARSRVLSELEALVRAEPALVGVTGGGAERLARRLPGAVPVNEFAAWGAGAAAMLDDSAGDPMPRYLLVSLGTGTSVLLVDGMSVMRVGGTALGGGTLLGLSAGLIGTSDFERITDLARRGSRRCIDLLVSDLYPAGGIPLAGDLTASNFARLAPRLQAGEHVAEADIAHALMGLLGENVALICAGLAGASQVRHIVFAGSTLHANDALVRILGDITRALGRDPIFLPNGHYAGALGALLLAHSATA